MNELALSDIPGPLSLDIVVERWRLKEPFRITGKMWEVLDVLVVSLKSADKVGRGEAAGVYFLGDTVESMVPQLEAVRRFIEPGLTRGALQRLLPAGGARNALDCAFWDLEAKLSGVPAWQRAALQPLKPLLTSFGCGAEAPEKMAALARKYTQARAIKLKLTGQDIDRDRVTAVREARPDVWLGVDANQGFTFEFLESILPTLVEAQVSLIEQPLPIGQEGRLKGFQSPIPIAADEAVRTAADLEAVVGCVQVVNIKLDKCGGLTEGLMLAMRAHECGLRTMVGNMIGTSLAMAPAIVIGQLCSVVDLDGPIFLAEDRPITVDYTNGLISAPEGVWGLP